jgi:hypothetical protein
MCSDRDLVILANEPQRAENRVAMSGNSTVSGFARKCGAGNMARGEFKLFISISFDDDRRQRDPRYFDGPDCRTDSQPKGRSSAILGRNRTCELPPLDKLIYVCSHKSGDAKS